MSRLFFGKMEKKVSVKHPLMISEQPNRIATRYKIFHKREEKQLEKKGNMMKIKMLKLQ